MKNGFWDTGKRHCAVITGASAGIGMEFARLLGAQGCFLVLSGRNKKALDALRAELGEDNCAVITADLSDTKSCIDLFAEARKYDPDILINNAGFGLFGEFTETSLSKELEMIDVNIKAMHILFKLFLKYFCKKDRGYILNVASSAGLSPGPLMSTYYSTKSYVIRQTQAVYEELRRKKSKVHVSVLCPGPVSTDFNLHAGIEGAGFFKGITPRYCAAYTLRKMRDNKLMIIPTVQMKLTAAALKFAPVGIACFGAYCVQSGKRKISK